MSVEFHNFKAHQKYENYTSQEVASRLVELCREGKNDQAVAELYSDNIVSIEPHGAPTQRCEGIEAVKQKSAEWFNSLQEYHGGHTSEPLVAANHFTVSMGMDITFKERGRMQMEELAVYQVDKGKIVKEEFFFPIG